MVLKVWSIVLVSALVFILLISFFVGMISFIDLALLILAFVLLLGTYLTLIRKDSLSKVPTALELEKMKRKLKAEESGILFDPGKKT
jgi:hypothetical protein